MNPGSPDPASQQHAEASEQSDPDLPQKPTSARSSTSNTFSGGIANTVIQAGVVHGGINAGAAHRQPDETEAVLSVFRAAAESGKAEHIERLVAQLRKADLNAEADAWLVRFSSAAVQSVTARLQDLADRDPVADDRMNGHLYLIVHPTTSREDALVDPLGNNPIPLLDAAVRRAVKARGGPGFSPDITTGLWRRCSDGFTSTQGIGDGGQIREASLLEVYVREDGTVSVLCGTGTAPARSPWRRLGQTGEPPTRRVVLPDLVIGLTHSVLALAGDLADKHAEYQGRWRIGLRLDRLRGAFAYDHVWQGDDDVIYPYDQDIYERTVSCSTQELLSPTAVTEQLVGPLLRGLAIDRASLPHGARP